MGAARQPDSAEVDDLADEGSGGGLFAEINITPLTDVFLVMVIIFMVSALAVQSEAQKKEEEVAEELEKSEALKSGLKVTLPSGAAKELDLTKQSLILVIPVTGDVQVDGTPVPDDKIDNAFRSAFLKDQQMQVVLQADKGVQHGRVVNLMERAKRAGLTRLAIGTTAGP
jgi:biopolymer transport protein ExbD